MPDVYNGSLGAMFAAVEKRLEEVERTAQRPRGTGVDAGLVVNIAIDPSAAEQALND